MRNFVKFSWHDYCHLLHQIDLYKYLLISWNRVIYSYLHNKLLQLFSWSIITGQCDGDFTATKHAISSFSSRDYLVHRDYGIGNINDNYSSSPLCATVVYIYIFKSRPQLLKVILCASEPICSIVWYCFRSFKQL